MDVALTLRDPNVFPALFQGVEDVLFRPKSISIILFSTILYVDAVWLRSAVSETLLHNGVPLKLAENTGKPLLEILVGCQLVRSDGSRAIVSSGKGDAVAPYV